MRSEKRTVDAVVNLAGALEALELGEGHVDLLSTRDRLARTLRSYLVPRIRDPDMPMRVVVAGPTGSGKSTLVNTLSGMDASPTGPLRPTTGDPVIVASKIAAPVLSEIGGVGCEVVFAETPLLDTMSLVDTPDIDSTETSHRVVAEKLIDDADVVVFVTSALRYSDEVPWEVLRRAVSRGAPVITILNRVSSASTGSIVDFRTRLRNAGLGDDVLMVAEHHHSGDTHRIPSTAVRSLSKRLVRLAAERAEHRGRIRDRVLSVTIARVLDLADTIEEINTRIDSLESELSIAAHQRVDALDFDGVATAMYETPWPEDGKPSLRRWKRRNRMSPLEMAMRERQLEARIGAIVHTDVRRWLTDTEIPSGQPIDIGPIVGSALGVQKRAVDGWLDFVRRIAEPAAGRDLALVEVLLIDSATRASAQPGLAMFFDDETEEVAGRARRELLGRIEVVYGHLIEQLTQTLRIAGGDDGPDSLRAAAGEVAAVFAMANA